MVGVSKSPKKEERTKETKKKEAKRGKPMKKEEENKRETRIYVREDSEH
jgi:hypothetical protein